MDKSILRGIFIILIAVAAIAVMFLLPGEQPEKHEHANLDAWTLVSHDYDDPYGTYLGNGFISARIKSDGVGSQGGRPLPCYMAGLYDDEELIPTPVWSDLRFYDEDGDEFTIDTREDYYQKLLMKSGVFVTSATWRSGRKQLIGAIEVVVSRSQPNIALVLANLTSNFRGKVRVESPVTIPNDRVKETSRDNLDVTDSVRASVHSYVTSESGIPLSIAKTLVSEAASGPQTDSGVLELSVDRDYKFMVMSYSTVATGHDVDSAAGFASDEIRSAVQQGLDLREQHVEAWRKLWERDIVIDGPAKDQQAIHSCMFYLLQSVREGSQWSIPPMGLSSADFQGHVFWDADVWMFPALILQHPELARSVVDYRFNTLQGAIENARAEGLNGAQYAWESGLSGREDTPPGLSMRDERHINGDVALAQWQYYLATGDLNWLKERGYPVMRATADYWVEKAVYAADEDRYEIHQVVPPDESADRVNNSVYTNAIAKMNLQIAQTAARLTKQAPDPKWGEVAEKLYIPFDSRNRRFIAFDGYKGIKAKQADAELLAYPLQFVVPDQDMLEVYRNTLEFYAANVMPGGPAMSASAHSVIHARLGNSEEAYEKFQQSYKPFLRGPFNYFNEKRSHVYERMCFITGAAGPLQAVLFGIGGARMEYFSEDPLAVDLEFFPCLPKEWKSLQIKGVQWRGKTFDVIVSRGNQVELANVRSLQ